MIPFHPEEAIRILKTTPSTLRAMLSPLDDHWLHADEGPDTWSPHEVVAHLIYGEQTDWIPRMRIILGHQDHKTFTPFDRNGHKPLAAGRPIDALLTEFEQWRFENLQILSGTPLTDADLDKTGVHPTFGPVTLRQLLAAWVTHDMTHIYQIARVMALQYKVEAGPWKAFMRILE